MNLNSRWNTVLEKVKKIAGTELMLFSSAGEAVASTCLPGGDDGERAKQFETSGADSQSFGELCFVRVSVKGKPDLVLAGRGAGDILTVLRLTALQIEELMSAEDQWFDQENFMKQVILGRLLPEDAAERAKRFRLDGSVKRAVFLIQTADKGPDRDAVLEVLRPLYGKGAGGFLFQTDESRYVYVRNLKEGECTEQLEEIGRNIVDVINTEAMEDAFLSFGTPAEELFGLPRAYEEACLAMEVGRIFGRENHVTAYEMLGVGRLIYSLPMPLCRKFLDEVFALSGPGDLDEETLVTIRRFFDDSLNTAETARHLYIHRNTLVYRLDRLQKLTGLNIRNFEEAVKLKLGLMVYEYVKDQELKEGRSKKTEERYSCGFAEAEKTRAKK